MTLYGLVSADPMAHAKHALLGPAPAKNSMCGFWTHATRTMRYGSAWSQKRSGSWTLYSSLNMVWWEIQHKFGYLNIWSFPPYCTGSSCSRNHGLRRCGSSPWSFGELMCSLVSTLMYILHYLPSIAITMILRNWVYIDPLKCVHCWAWSSLINFEDLVHFPLNMDLYGICYLTLVEPCTDPIRASY